MDSMEVTMTSRPVQYGQYGGVVRCQNGSRAGMAQPVEPAENYVAAGGVYCV